MRQQVVRAAKASAPDPVTDYFALLGCERRPWLEEEELKKRFLELSRAVHPDRVHELSPGAQQLAASRSAEINAAYACLAEPKTRLQHLLELEGGVRPTDLQNVPVEMTTFFLTISQLNREVDSFLKEKQQIASPLLKLQLFEKSQEYIDRLQELLKTVEARNAALIVELKEADRWWVERDPSHNRGAGMTEKLEDLYRLFGFHSRWAQSLRERVGRLNFEV